MTDVPTIEALPPPPQRGQDPAMFIQRADVFIDALAAFVAQINVFGAQLVAATQERVVNEALGSYEGAVAARDAALAARDAARRYAESLDAGNIVHRTGDELIAGTKNFADVVQLAGKALTLAATYPEASAADMVANVASRLVSVRALWDALVSVALADAATIAVDLATGVNFTVTVTANRVLANPTNGKPGQHGSIFVTQGGAGGFVLSFGAAYVPDDLVTYPLINAGAGAVTELRYKVAADGKVRLYGGKAVSGYALTFYQEGTYNLGYSGSSRVVVGAAGRMINDNCSMFSTGQLPNQTTYNIMRLRNGTNVVVGNLTFAQGSRSGVFNFTDPSVVKNDVIWFQIVNSPASAPSDVTATLFVSTN